MRSANQEQLAIAGGILGMDPTDDPNASIGRRALGAGMDFLGTQHQWKTIPLQGFRGTNTMLYGGWAVDNPTFRGARQWWRPFKATFGYSGYEQWDRSAQYGHLKRFVNPGRFREGNRVGESIGGMTWGKDHYTPFGTPNLVNSMTQRLANGPFGTRGMQSTLRKYGIIKDFGEATTASGKTVNLIEPVLAKGFMGRVAASGKYMQMGSQGKITEQMLGHFDAYMDRVATPELKQSLLRRAGGIANPAEMGNVMGETGLMSIEGTVSGRMAGYIAESRGMTAVGRSIAREGATDAFKAGASLAERHGAELAANAARVGVGVGEKGFARAAVKGAVIEAKELAVKAGEKAAIKTVAKTALETGGKAVLRDLAADAATWWIPGVDLIMAAWTVYDIAKLGLSLGKIAADEIKQFTGDAVKSFEGGINKGPMDHKFEDTTVSMTSRNRGVQAIQNSRLNARSILGSEAALMHQHFG